MSFTLILILAVIQGLTEFLPVSSKTHLQIAQHFMGREPDLALTIVLHAGSLAAILVYYRRAWLELLKSTRREILLLAIGALPAVATGLALKKHLEHLYGTALLLGATLLIVNGLFLLVADRLGREKHTLADLPAWKALVIGFAQAAALLPGISRSGSTIGAGYLVGLRRADAIRFSFFLGAILIAGALALMAKKLMEGQAGFAPVPILLGVIVSFAVSLAAIRVVEILSPKGRFALFAAYCAAAGIAGVLYFSRG